MRCETAELMSGYTTVLGTMRRFVLKHKSGVVCKVFLIVNKKQRVLLTAVGLITADSPAV